MVVSNVPRCILQYILKAERVSAGFSDGKWKGFQEISTDDNKSRPTVQGNEMSLLVSETCGRSEDLHASSSVH